jgi:hypothetical protein
MKMIMIIGPKERNDDIVTLIESHGVRAYTEMREVVGEGATGKKLGTVPWPDQSFLLFTIVPADKKDELLAALKTYRTGLYAAEGLKAFVLPVEESI